MKMLASRKDMWRNGLRAVAMLSFVSLAGGVSGTTCVWTGGAGNNDWTDRNNFEGGSAPSAGDVVEIPNSMTVTISSSNSASWALASTLERIAPQGNGSRIILHVAEGEQDFCAGITRELVWNSQVGVVEKTGAGKVNLCKYWGYYDYFVNELLVSEGTVSCEKIKSAEYFKTIRIAQGATFVTSGSTLWAEEVLGEGVMTTKSGWDTRIYGGTAERFTVVEALLGSGVTYAGSSYVRFLRTDNLMPNFSVYAGVTEIGDIGMAGTPSTTGCNWSFGFNSMGVGTIRYVGTADTVTDKEVYIDNGTDTAPGLGTFDAGPHGGITFNGAWLWAPGQWGRSHLLAQFILTGSNTVPCRINGKVGCPASSYGTSTLGIVKKGSGAWRLSNAENFFDSTIDVQQGELGFDSIKERGEVCSLGTAADLKSPENHGDYSSAEDVSYAFRLGSSLLMYPAEGLATLRSYSSVKSSCTTRPIALAGDGRIVSDSGRLVIRGATSIADGLNRLVLGGDNASITNVFHDVTDGATAAKKTGIVKEGAGTWLLTGTNTWSGPLVVNGGRLILKRPSDVYSWYRLVIKDSCRIDWPGDGFDCYKLGRVGLFDRDGYRRNIGLTYVSEFPQNSGAQANDHIPSFLEAGQFGWGMPNRYSGGDYQTLSHICSDGLAWDNSCLFLIRENVRSHYAGDPDKYVYIDIRLPTGSPEIAYYDLASVYGRDDYLALYNIKSWTLLGSTDGITWDELHSVADVMSGDPNQKMKLPTVGSSWMAQDSSTDWNSAATQHDTTRLQEIPSRRTGGTVPFLESGISSVTLANGAVLEGDGEMTLSKFRVAYGETACTIKGFALADRCEIEVAGIPNAVSGFDALVFEETQAEGAEWVVTEGGNVSRRYEAVVGNGRLRIVRKGLVIICR